MRSALRLSLAPVALFAVLSCSPDAPQGAMGRLGLVSEGAVEQAAQVCPGGDTLFGIDVSKWQGDIDWSQVAWSTRSSACRTA